MVGEVGRGLVTEGNTESREIGFAASRSPSELRAEGIELWPKSRAGIEQINHTGRSGDDAVAGALRSRCSTDQRGRTKMIK